MSNHDTPEPYETLELQSIVDGELARVDMEDKYTRHGLLDHVRKCIVTHAERIRDNADETRMGTFVTATVTEKGFFINEDDFDDLEALLDDLKTIETEGW